jgi:hypothetical protein
VIVRETNKLSFQPKSTLSLECNSLVSEVKDWIFTGCCSLQIHALDIWQMMEHLLAGQAEINATEEAHQESMLDFQRGLRTRRKEMTACLIAVEGCPDNSKADLEETDATDL